ncbi:DUF3106 domain-containing protein [Thermomonas carbonis]|uniref:DUF3106 domain-containing protein n=1 Tax=Thermomonas carbonis TaxID=1463158 RepID=A0A7G9STE6_9GAMM|nr:DUF3106 domain-containing protein [Thermomonas carbonis]QNN71121.1 DUF3106 domain-containing protein [Thermomonas carbonis]GHC12384.1 hypothetical protein GCM10010080_30050 [Thermomonas carbonis]
MTPAAPDTPSPAAVTAFLRGLDRRARLFAGVQAGDEASARHALAVVARVFAGEAGQWPLAEWPRQYWRLLLAAPSMRKPPAEASAPRLPGIARLAVETRAAVLLHLVAALDDADAAGALGIDTAAYQARIRDALPLDALGQPDVDVWRTWRAAAERELAQLAEPEAPKVGSAKVGSESTFPRKVDSDPTFADPTFDTRHRHRLRWLWAGVVLCVLALMATFFLHPRGREVLDQWRAEIKREPLDAAAAPKARFDAGDLALHPDRELLSMPGELGFAVQLPLLAWLEVAGADPRAADAVRLPVIVAATDAGMSIAADDAAPLPRVQRWDALSPTSRATRRGAWQAWRTLRPAERVRLRAIATRWRLLGSEEQAALRARFDALPADARHGWWLGPDMGRHWPRVAALFAFAPASQRDALLALLRAADAEDIDALERLAQITPPEERDALRLDLLRVPLAQRRAWMLAKVQG